MISLTAEQIVDLISETRARYKSLNDLHGFQVCDLLLAEIRETA